MGEWHGRGEEGVIVGEWHGGGEEGVEWRRSQGEEPRRDKWRLRKWLQIRQEERSPEEGNRKPGGGDRGVARGRDKRSPGGCSMEAGQT